MALLLCFTVCGPDVQAQKKKKPQPDVGYLFPAGGQQGTTVRVLAGGQMIRDAKGVLVDGTGVEGSVVKKYKPFNNLNGEQNKEFRRQVRVRTATLAGRDVKDKDKQPIMEEDKIVLLPNHPLFEGLESMTERELLFLTNYIKTYRRTRQLNAQLRDVVGRLFPISTRSVPARAKKLR